MYASNIVLCLVWTKSVMYNMVQKKINKTGGEQGCHSATLQGVKR